MIILHLHLIQVSQLQCFKLLLHLHVYFQSKWNWSGDVVRFDSKVYYLSWSSLVQYLISTTKYYRMETWAGFRFTISLVRHSDNWILQNYGFPCTFQDTLWRCKVCTGAIKPRPNDRNMSTQHIATLLGATCCVRLATVLRHVGCCWVKFENGQIWAKNTQHVATHRNTVAKRT